MNYDKGKIIYELEKVKVPDIKSIPLNKQDELAKYQNQAWNRAVEECIRVVKELDIVSIEDAIELGFWG